MSCKNPIFAVKYGEYINDSGELVDNIKILGLKPEDNVTNLMAKYGDMLIPLPCGKCPDCRADKAKNWSLRCYLESLSHQENCFITLTYNDEHRPGVLVKKHVQNFIRDLRRSHTVRYFCCGEYGSQSRREHYHILLFGYIPKDIQFIGTTEKGSNLYTSKELSELWKYGFVSVGLLEPESIAYTCRYTMKKITDHYVGYDNAKEFILMSRRPGLGRSYIEEHGEELLKNEKFYLGEFGIKNLTRYVRDILEDLDPTKIHILKEKNLTLAKVINNHRKYSLKTSEDLLLKNDFEDSKEKEKRKNRDF